MEIGLHFIGYLLAFFFAYLYFPNLVFKFVAEYSVDLGRRRDDGELEEFFAAVIPSTILNIFTWLFLLLRGSPSCYLDYSVIAAVMTDKKEAIHAAVSDPAMRHAFFVYLFTLLGVSVLNGLAYGFAVRRKMLQPDIRQRRPKSNGAEKTGVEKWLVTAWWFVKSVWWIGVEIISGVYYQVWHPIFHEQVISFFPWSVQRPFVFIRMHDSRLYYGQFLRYDKAADGDVESITIDQVYRYCYDEVDRCLMEGRIPLSPFQGSLRISVREIADVHNVPEKHFLSIVDRYKKMRVLRLARELLDAFAGQTATVSQIWIEYAGGTFHDVSHYRQALRYLEGEGFVSIQHQEGEIERFDPPSSARVTFPRRVRSPRPWDMEIGFHPRNQPHPDAG